VAILPYEHKIIQGRLTAAQVVSISASKHRYT